MTTLRQRAEIKEAERNAKKYNSLVEKYSSEVDKLLPNAEENLDFVKKSCKNYVKMHGVDIKVAVSKESGKASVAFELPFVIFANAEYRLLEEIKDRIDRVLLFPKGYRLEITLELAYFDVTESPAKRAARELFFSGGKP